VDKAWERDYEDSLTSDDNPRLMGVDVGFTFDPGAYIIRKGNVIEDAAEFANLDPVPFADFIMARFDTGERIDHICVDSDGNGYPIYDILFRAGYPVIPVRASEVIKTRNICRKNRDWFWWKCGVFFRDYRVKFKYKTPEMEKLCVELCQPGYKKENGEIKVESKKELYSRGIKSPNLADALNVTFDFDSMFRREPDEIKKVDSYRALRKGRKRAIGLSWMTV